MNRTEILENYITKSGKTKCHLADAMGCSRPTFYKTVKDPLRASYKQATFLKDELSISAPDMKLIFLP